MRKLEDFAYYGKPCKNINHVNNNKTLRYKSNRICIECRKIKKKKAYHSIKNKVQVCCHLCNKVCYKAKSDVKRRKHLFCSNKCKNKFGNSQLSGVERSKRAIKLHNNRKRCEKCNNKMSTYKYKNICIRCHNSNTLTLEDLDKMSKGLKRYYKEMVSDYAREVVKNRVRECYICGYSKHVECCHIRAIKDFPKTALLSEVNDDKNLVLLCPNHHKELDKNLLEFPIVRNPADRQMYFDFSS